MSHKKGNLPPHNDATVSYRTLTVRAREPDAASGAIPVVLATEAPVKAYDRTLRKVVSEVLLMSGCEIPQQVPMTDEHTESSRAIVGSIRSLQVNGDELHGQSHFSSKRSAQEMKQDVLDGHITDMSVGAVRLQEVLIDTGKEEVVSGRRYKGPARIVTRWRPIHGAVVGQGADGRSVFTPSMRAYREPETLYEEAMTETLRSHLESLGMPKEHSDEQALDWMKANTTRKQESPPAPAAPTIPDATTSRGAAIEVKDDAALKKAAEDAAKIERQRVKDIRTSVRAASLDDTFADDLIERGSSKGEAAQAILDELSKRNKPHGAGIEAVGSEKESFRKAMLDGLSLRIGHRPEANEKLAPGHQEFRRLRFLDLVKRNLEFEGVSTRNMDERDMVARAFSASHSLRASDGQAYHTTGNFANLLLDAQNKTLLKSFTDFPSTYQIWARQAESVPDFKTIYRIRLGEVGNQPMVEENGEYKDMALSDNKESYRIEKHGSIVSLTWEAMKNDDLSGFSRLVTLQGAAMRRTINRSVYQVLFDNPNLSDGVALFHATSHGANLDTNDISIANLSVGWNVMMLQTGLNSDVILGITPRHLIVSAADSAAVEQILGSFADPGAGGSAAGNSNTLNIYGPGGQRKLNVIVEPLLDGNDADSWYLVADNMMVDTLEYTFLQGEESPVFEQETAFIQDAIKYKVRQTWGVAAIDYRGLYKSSGSG